MDSAALKHSFAELKKTARCDADVHHWFCAHPEVLPYISDALVGQARIQLIPAPFMATRVDTKQNTYFRSIELQYYLEHKVEHDAVFSDILQQTPVTSDEGPILQRSFQLKLDAREWRYVGLDPIYTYVKTDGMSSPMANRLRPTLEQLWIKHFPQMAFADLTALAQADLLPNSRESFSDWAFGLLQAPSLSINLPTDFHA